MDDSSADIDSAPAALGEVRRDDEFQEVVLGVLGHDLRNPLAAILTSARLAIRRGALPLSDQKTIARIVSSGERMQAMIGEIMDLTRSRQRGGIPLRAEVKDLRESVADAIDGARARFPDTSVESSVEQGRVFLAHVDAARIRQVLATLLDSAIRHSPPGRGVRVAVRSDAVYVTISIHNDGPPIPPDARASFFDPVARTHDGRPHSPEGLGLGLYLADCLVRAHGGTIHVASTVDEGTTFSFSLARASDEAGASR